MAEPDLPDPRSDNADAPKDPKASAGWLAMLEESEKVYKDYHSRCDNIDKQYAEADRLANTAGDRQFQMFWANIQVLGPSIYSRPPIPVVVPRFKDRKPLPRVTSEILERSTVVTFEMQDVDSILRQVRDDLIISARGVAWCRYETKTGGKYRSQKVCIEYINRKDFRHDPARTWQECDWVARATYPTKTKMEERFKGKDFKATFEDRKDEETEDGLLKAKVWEIWCKSKDKVIWVAEGCDEILEEDDPELELEGFFPCPRPAYGTTQRGSLVPVPDWFYYKDQLAEINELTARISALSDALKVRGFYPAGAGEIGDAIEAAIKETTDNQVLIPISNWAMVGAGGVKDMIVWLPLDMIATTIVQLVELRRQLIDDVYQITGLSDIMRGSTEASETLGAQELKSQYGSIRIRDRQSELVRMARDLTRITAEIMAENFKQETLLEMSQVDIETDAEIAEQVKTLEGQIMAIVQQVEAAKSDPQMMQQAQANPEQAQQMLQQAHQQAEQLKGQIGKLNERPTIEKVMKFLRDQRTRPYALDIETDSTIAPDENATKQRATEFITAVGGFMREALPLVQAVPQSATLMSETLKYTASQFRAGRQLEGAIEEFADNMKQMASQPKPPDPEQAKAAADAQATQMKAQTDAQTAQATAQKTQADAMQTQADAERTTVEAQSKAAEDEQNRRIALAEAVDAARARSADIDGKKALTDLDMANKTQKHAQDMDIGVLQLEKLRLEIQGVQVKTEAAVATTQAKIDQTNTQTDNSIASTDASIEATERGTEIKAKQAKAKEPA